MKADAIHGRVWLTTLGRDSIHCSGGVADVEGKGDDDGLVLRREEVRVLRGRRERVLRGRKGRGERAREEGIDK